MTLTPSSLVRLAEFERQLDPQNPAGGGLPARVLGYGEISTVFEIEADDLRGWAFKRLPLFYSHSEVERYTQVFVEYNRLLEQDIGLSLPAHDHAVVPNAKGRPVFYIIQQKLPAESIANRAIHQLTRDQVQALVRRVLQHARRVWDFNHRQSRFQVAIDGQISNWAIDGADLRYVDTSTPLFRVNGIEQLDTELFLRSAPSFLVWILRALFLHDVVSRYYDFHRVAVDLVANFYKEQKAELIPAVIETVNDFFATDAKELRIAPLTEKEVRNYYKEDAQIWSLYFNMRKVDRFLRLRILRGDYPYILPASIQR